MRIHAATPQENEDVDTWMKRRLGAMFVKHFDLNEQQVVFHSTTKFVLLNVEASLGNEIVHFVVLTQAQTRTMEGCKEPMNKGDMDFKIVNVFYYPTCVLFAFLLHHGADTFVYTLSRSETGLLVGM